MKTGIPFIAELSSENSVQINITEQYRNIAGDENAKLAILWFNNHIQNELSFRFIQTSLTQEMIYDMNSLIQCRVEEAMNSRLIDFDVTI